MDERLKTGWKLQHIAQNIYKIVHKDGYITMTGSDVTTKLQIPFPHRWLRTMFCHTTSAGVLDAAGTYMEISCPQTAGFPTKFKDYLIREYDIKAQTWGEWFGVGFEYESRTWDIILNTDSGDLIYPYFVIQKLGNER